NQEIVVSSLLEFTDTKFIKFLKSKNKYKAIEELADVFKGTDVCSDIKAFINALKEREEIMTTGIGFGIAVPHAKLESVHKIAFAIGISKKGIDFNSIDGKPVHLVVLVAAGERQHKEYLKLLSKIMSVLKNDIIRNEMIQAKSTKDIIEILRNAK
ncbi:MAG TPA: PTS sugar transporter subunit IIA, partial [Spirochaetota bacterium]|nr:PTS sugar transporter subunit IIA [Spirochaetota bacterium]